MITLSIVEGTGTYDGLRKAHHRRVQHLGVLAALPADRVGALLGPLHDVVVARERQQPRGVVPVHLGVAIDRTTVKTMEDAEACRMRGEHRWNAIAGTPFVTNRPSVDSFVDSFVRSFVRSFGLPR